MANFTPFNTFSSILKENRPAAGAVIHGNADNPKLFGTASFYNTPFGGIIVNVEVYGLPDAKNNTMSDSAGHSPENPMPSNFYGMHIHETGNCTPPFDKTVNHYNPGKSLHPYHAGDMPPLLSNNDYAWISFYDSRITIDDIIGRSIVIHGMRDDFSSQPSGDSGMKIGCGVIS